jgi:MFS-type transporter involved in bile tolerance (Atg22 family)
VLLGQFIDNNFKIKPMKKVTIIWMVIACMINISIFGQSRAKKKEIIADSKIAKEIY